MGAGAPGRVVSGPFFSRTVVPLGNGKVISNSGNDAGFKSDRLGLRFQLHHLLVV